MTFRAASLVALLLATQVACVAEAGEEIGESSDAVTTGRIIVRQFGSPGPELSKWGYDVKQDGRSRALKPALAQEIFGEIGMNLLRVPVRAKAAHPARGVDAIKKGEYADDIDAVKTVKAVKPTADVFASVKLLGRDSFPAWVQSGGDVDADKYAALLEDYLAYMNQSGVTIDWLGIDNESKFNEGNITPAKYNRIAEHVRGWCKDHGVKVPGFIAAENYGPTEDTPWLQNLWQSPSKFQNVDHVGVHYYSKHRDAAYAAALDTLSNDVHGKGLWDSELHWNDLEDNGVHFDDVKPGLLAAMDHFDQGFRAITWWAFQPKSNETKPAFIMSELVSSTIGAQPLPTDDKDGKAIAMNKLNARALKNDAHHVTLWVGNFDGKDRKDQVTEIANQEVTAASFVQWSPNSPDAGKAGSAKVTAKGFFSMSFPANTITRVSVTVK